MKLRELIDLPKEFDPEQHRYPIGVTRSVEDQEPGWTGVKLGLIGKVGVVRAVGYKNGGPSWETIKDLTTIDDDTLTASDVLTAGSTIVLAIGPSGEVPECTAYKVQ